jgi:hypothetical protein
MSTRVEAVLDEGFEVARHDLESPGEPATDRRIRDGHRLPALRKNYKRFAEDAPTGRSPEEQLHPGEELT